MAVVPSGYERFFHQSDIAEQTGHSNGTTLRLNTTCSYTIFMNADVATRMLKRTIERCHPVHTTQDAMKDSTPDWR